MPHAKAKIKILAITRQLFLDTIVKNKNRAHASKPIQTVRYKFKNKKERRSTPKIKPKQTA